MDRQAELAYPGDRHAGHQSNSTGLLEEPKEEKECVSVPVRFCCSGGDADPIGTLLFAYNRWKDHQAGQASERLMGDMEAPLESWATLPQESSHAGTVPIGTLEPELPVVTIDGHDYVGYLEFEIWR